MENVIWCFFGAVIFSFGVWFLARPDDWLEEFNSEADPVREPSHTRIAWRIRAVGIAFVVIGVLWVYCLLFVAPAPDALLF